VLGLWLPTCHFAAALNATDLTTGTLGGLGAGLALEQRSSSTQTTPLGAGHAEAKRAGRTGNPRAALARFAEITRSRTLAGPAAGCRGGKATGTRAAGRVAEQPEALKAAGPRA
jgi:hypothetical protein